MKAIEQTQVSVTARLVATCQIVVGAFLSHCHWAMGVTQEDFHHVLARHSQRVHNHSTVRMEHIWLSFVAMSSKHVCHGHHCHIWLMIYGEKQISVITRAFWTKSKFQGADNTVWTYSRNPPARAALQLTEGFLEHFLIFADETSL